MADSIRRTDGVAPGKASRLIEEEGWCVIPPTILVRKDVSAREKLLIGVIGGRMTPQGYCHMTNACLGKTVGIAKQTVANLMMEMTRKELVSVTLVREETGRIVERRIYPRWNGNARARGVNG